MVPRPPGSALLLSQGAKGECDWHLVPGAYMWEPALPAEDSPSPQG